MESGSQATRGIADIVLLNDSFAALPAAFAEGQRIRNGMESAMKLFLTRVLYLALLLLTIPMLGAFPFAPKQKALVTFETIGIMAVALAAWAHPGPPSRRGLGHLFVHFVLPGAVTLSLVAFGVYLLTFIPWRAGRTDALPYNAFGHAPLAWHAWSPLPTRCATRFCS